MVAQMSTERFISEFYPRSEIEAVALLQEMRARLKTIPGGYKPLRVRRRPKASKA